MSCLCMSYTRNNPLYTYIYSKLYILWGLLILILNGTETHYLHVTLDNHTVNISMSQYNMAYINILMSYQQYLTMFDRFLP